METSRGDETERIWLSKEMRGAEGVLSRKSTRKRMTKWDHIQNYETSYADGGKDSDNR